MDFELPPSPPHAESLGILKIPALLQSGPLGLVSMVKIFRIIQ